MWRSSNLCTVGGIEKLCDCYVKQYGGSSKKKKKKNYRVIQLFYLWIYIQKKAESQEDVCTPMHI